jgi:hypothetical protein
MCGCERNASGPQHSTASRPACATLRVAVTGSITRRATTNARAVSALPPAGIGDARPVSAHGTTAHQRGAEWTGIDRGARGPRQRPRGRAEHLRGQT